LPPEETIDGSSTPTATRAGHQHRHQIRALWSI
jgi:hypothetical protein